MAKKVPGIRKSGNGFEYRFTIRGRAYNGHADTIEDAKSKMAKTRTQVENGTYVERQNLTLTLNSYYDDTWLGIKRDRDKVKGSTLCAYEKLYDLYIRNSIGKYPIQDIKAMDIDKLLTKLSGKLKLKSVQLVRTIITGIFRWATFNEIIKINPCLSLPKTPGKDDSDSETHRGLSQKEIDAFLSQADSDNSEFKYFFRFMLLTGVRCGEAIGLERRDIDMTNMVIHISRTATVDENGKRIIGDSPKSKKGKRDIPIDDQLAEVIRSQQKLNYELWGHRSEGFESKLFYSLDGKNIIPQTVNKRIETILNHYNAAHPNDKIKRFSSHALRDSFGTAKAMKGAEVKTLSVLMGHSSTRITLDKYVKPLYEDKLKVMELA